jgi:hypothetical protein
MGTEEMFLLGKQRNIVDTRSRLFILHFLSSYLSKSQKQTFSATIEAAQNKTHGPTKIRATNN